ncbi:hypothetical protein N7492_005572 [Penicillium capsulatum]|uniref:Uncharacterized protein n=1 Tax=Penicillium capsulatum TaxID=69766 RepID=A0A9W9I9M5_9EURO|nr:hypothetical protein N7492_005572 [Penicillium capsulatum]KAJ6135328.1 hypothetical protein N7512_000488 [Penicillium capsulatum]
MYRLASSVNKKVTARKIGPWSIQSCLTQGEETPSKGYVQAHPEIKIPEFQPLILSLVQKLHSGGLKNRPIEHIPYKSVIEAVGGATEFSQIALDAIDPRVLALQKKMVNVKMQVLLDKVRESQSRELNPWPHTHGGFYLDYVTDLRDHDYWRSYVDQTSDLAQRIPQHCRAIRKGKTNALHYYIITKSSAAGFRYDNFIRWDIDDSVSEAFENVLEMTFVRAFQSISPGILEEYFGPCPEGAYAKVGLNIVPPLIQGRELAPTVRRELTKLLETCDDPEINEWPNIRGQQEMQPRTSKSHMTTFLRFTPEQYLGFFYESIERHSGLAGTIRRQNKDKFPYPMGTLGIRLHGGKLIWFADFQKYKLISRTLRVTRQGAVDTEILSACAQDLIEKSNMSVILLCGQMAEDVALLEEDRTRALELRIQGLEYRVWLRTKGYAIDRIFVRSPPPPPPLLKLWSTQGPAAQKIGALFKFVAAITSVKIFPGFFESALTVSLIVRGVDDERAGRVDPLALQISSLDPTLRIWLEKLGFTTDEDVQKLAKACNESVKLGLLVLSKILPRKSRLHSKRIPDSLIRRRGTIAPGTLDQVRLLLKETQRSRFCLPDEEDATTRSLSPDESDLVEESTLIETKTQGSIFLEESGLEGTRDLIPPPEGKKLRECLQKMEKLHTMALGKILQLLNGYYFKGTEINQGGTVLSNSTSSTQLSESMGLPRIPNANANDPGIRFALRVSLRDDYGKEYFHEYPKSFTWQAIIIAIPLVDGLSGDAFEEICLRPRRFVFIDKRHQNVPPDLKPFINGAYRGDDGELVKFGKQKED